MVENLVRRPLAALEGARMDTLDLTRPMSDPIAALPQGEDASPIDGFMPTSLIVLPSSSETYCEPWSEWCAHPRQQAPTGRSHPARIVGQARVQMPQHRPADHPTQTYINHDCEVESAPGACARR